MKRIAIFTDNLKVGGIQKSIVNLLNNISLDKYEVDLFLFDKDNFYEIPPKINIVYLKKPSKIFQFIPFSIVKKIMKLDIPHKKYDLSIDFDSYQMHTAIGALTCESENRAIWIHNDIPIKLKEEKKYRILHFFFQKKYQYFDSFCAVSSGALDSFKSMKNNKGKKYYVIPNLIDTREIELKRNELCDFKVDKSKINIVSVGRLCHQKGYDIMINNIRMLKDIRDDFHLYIIGDGPDRKKLETQVKDLDLDDIITFLGNQENPFKFLNMMDIFYFTSRYEGQGMVILEALACGLDVVISKHLEKYCQEVSGTDDEIAYLSKYKKKNKKQFNNLNQYNKKVIESFENLVERG